LAITFLVEQHPLYSRTANSASVRFDTTRSHQCLPKYNLEELLHIQHFQPTELRSVLKKSESPCKFRKQSASIRIRQRYALSLAIWALGASGTLPTTRLTRSPQIVELCRSSLLLRQRPSRQKVPPGLLEQRLLTTSALPILRQYAGNMSVL
jgi:hypothetical protein